MFIVLHSCNALDFITNCKILKNICSISTYSKIILWNPILFYYVYTYICIYDTLPLNIYNIFLWIFYLKWWIYQYDLTYFNIIPLKNCQIIVIRYTRYAYAYKSRVFTYKWLLLYFSIIFEKKGRTVKSILLNISYQQVPLWKIVINSS